MDGIMGHELTSHAALLRINPPAGLFALHQKDLTRQPATLYAIINTLSLIGSLEPHNILQSTSCLDTNTSQHLQDYSRQLHR